MDIFVYGDIGWDFDSRTMIALLQNAEGKDIRLRINSRGGSFIEAIAIFNIIKERGNITTYVEGAAISAAAIIALAGSKVLMAQNGLMMIHAPMMPVDGKTAEELRAQAEILDKATVALKETIKSKCKKEDKDIDDLLSKESWFTSYEAYNYGLVDEIVAISNVSVVLDDIQSVPDVILNHVRTKGEKEMPIRDLLAKLDLKAEETATEDQIVDLIVNSFKKQVKKEVPVGVKKIIKNYRDSEINNLVSSGKITAAVATELKLQYCADDILNTAINEDGTASDDFEKLMGALNKNEQVINFGGRTGTQRMDNPAQKDSKNALLQDMEARK